MALILVKNRARTGDEFDYDLDDPIMIAEDTFTGWGAKELDTSRFRIVWRVGPRSSHTYLLTPEPATVRDIYPRSMLQARRMRLKLSKEVIKSDSPRRLRRQRLYTITGSAPAVKQIPPR